MALLCACCQVKVNIMKGGIYPIGAVGACYVDMVIMNEDIYPNGAVVCLLSDEGGYHEGRHLP